jgi:putative transcriptional regulator
MTRDSIRRKTKPVSGSRVGDDLVEAFQEMAAYLRGEIEVESYSLPDLGAITPARIKAIRRKVASSTREFERLFGVSARTMETYEQGRRRPSRMALALLRIIDREPEAARRALGGRATAPRRLIPRTPAMLNPHA